MCNSIFRIRTVQLYRYRSQWNNFNLWYKWHSGHIMLHFTSSRMWFKLNDKQEGDFGWCPISWNGNWSSSVIECCNLCSVFCIKFIFNRFCLHIFLDSYPTEKGDAVSFNPHCLCHFWYLLHHHLFKIFIYSLCCDFSMDFCKFDSFGAS